MLAFLPTPIVVYLCCVTAGFGLIMGSALNCLALRLSRNEKWGGKSRSACPACGHVLTAPDLIPLFSWLFLRGKCRHCKAPISPRYPITEAVLSVVYVALLLKYDLSLNLITPVIFASCLFCLSLVDLDTQIIPDRFIVIPIIARAAELLLVGGLRGLLNGALPGLIIAGSVLVVSLIMDKVLGKETMGGGDIKLLFVIGMFLPLGQCLLMVIIACVIGILMASLMMKVNPETPFPFGPALSIAAVITLFIGSGVLNWYVGLF